MQALLYRQLIYTVQATTGTYYAIITRDQDLNTLDIGSGKFVDPATMAADETTYSPIVELTEHAVMKGFYYNDDTIPTHIPDGKYIVVIYKQSGGSPAPSTDAIQSSFNYFVTATKQVNWPEAAI